MLGLGLGVIALFGFGLAETPINSGEWLAGIFSEPAPTVGAEAPDFALISLDGESVRLSDLKGKPVVINFWATWCGPCVLEIPTIQRYYEEKEGEFEVLAVNADEEERDVRTFIDDIGATFPVLLDPGGNVQKRYQLRGYPTTYIVDADGVVRAQHIGLLDQTLLVNSVKNLGVAE